MCDVHFHCDDCGVPMEYVEHMFINSDGTSSILCVECFNNDIDEIKEDLENV